MTEKAAIRITDWLVGVTYKPGWEFSYAGTLTDGRVWITILATDRDTNNPQHGLFEALPLFEVTPDIDTREKFMDWLLDVCIPGIETHERWEWFRDDGKPWRNVHAPDMSAFATSREEFDKHGPRSR
jgi:hypothetical protein